MSDNSDPFHVMGNDNVIRTLDEHYDGKKDVEQDPYGAWLAIQNQAARIEELKAERDTLKAKLEAAVDILEKCPSFVWYEANVDDLLGEIDATLAKITGEADD